VSRFRDKPFVLLGVNRDPDREAARRAVTVKGLTWQSWWDGDGRLAARWKVRALPALFVLDGRGVVRFRFTPGPGLERALDEAVLKLLGELQG
jgi:hypothetical protein